MSVRAILDRLAPALEACFAARNAASGDEPIPFRLVETGYGAKITCFAADHPDRNASLELHYRDGHNWWTCRACSIAPQPRDSAITLVQQIWATEDHWARTGGATVTERSFTKAKQFCLDLIADGAATGGATVANLDESRAASEAARDANQAAAADVLQFILDRVAERRARCGTRLDDGIVRWYTMRGFPPGTDLYPDVVPFGGDRAYVELRKAFNDDTLDRAGFLTARRGNLFGLCGALFIYRNSAGTPVYCQGLRLPTEADVRAKLAERRERRSVAGRKAAGPPTVTGRETVDELVAKAAEIRDWHERARAAATIDGPPKYIGAAGMVAPWPFGMHRAASGGGTLVVCEGVPDALAAAVYRLGDAAIAVPGVNYPNRGWLRTALLDHDGRPKWDRVMLAFDGDRAGEDATRAFYDLVEAENIPHVSERTVWAAADAAETIRDLDGRIVIVRYAPGGGDLNDEFGVA